MAKGELDKLPVLQVHIMRSDGLYKRCVLTDMFLESLADPAGEVLRKVEELLRTMTLTAEKEPIFFAEDVL